MNVTTPPLLDVQDLGVSFSAAGSGFLGKKSTFDAVQNLSFNLSEGESFGIVGESGAGKTTLLRSIVGLIKPTGGRIVYRGSDVASLRGKTRKAFLRDVHLVFQNPYTAFHPKVTLGQALAEPLLIHKLATKEEARPKIADALEQVGLSPDFVARYPHQFSGGQRQRLVLARALVLGSQVLLADEPVSALDVSIQAQVLNLFRDLKRELNLSYVVVAHDLAVVRYLCDRVAVMLGGRFVEIAASEQLYSSPRHPYTQALLASAPTIKGGLEGKQLQDFAQRFTAEGKLTEIAPGHHVLVS